MPERSLTDQMRINASPRYFINTLYKAEAKKASKLAHRRHLHSAVVDILDPLSRLTAIPEVKRMADSVYLLQGQVVFALYANEIQHREFWQRYQTYIPLENRLQIVTTAIRQRVASFLP